MVIGIALASALLIALVVSVGLTVRDMRRLHGGGKSLTGEPIGAGGVSAAGMTVIGNNLTH